MDIPLLKRRNDSLAGTRLDPTNPLNEGLAGLWDFNYGDDDKVFDQSSKSNHIDWIDFSAYSSGVRGVGKAGNTSKTSSTYLRKDETYIKGFPFSMLVTMFKSIAESDASLFCIGTNTPTRGRFIIKVRGFSTTINRFTFVADDGSTNIIYPTPQNTSAGWTHICCVIKSNVYREMYINGISVGTSIVDIGFQSDIYTDGVVTIGAETLRGDALGATTSLVSEASLYNRVLTQDEIYNAYLNSAAAQYKSNFKTTVFIPTAPPSISPTPWHLFNI